MILSFKKKFAPKILEGSKIHTIRRDKSNRWEKNRTIHFATGLRTSQYNQFKEGNCSYTYFILIQPSVKQVYIGNYLLDDGFTIPECEMEEFVKNDGFESVDEFWDFFGKEIFIGKLIGWTDFDVNTYMGDNGSD